MSPLTRTVTGSWTYPAHLNRLQIGTSWAGGSETSPEYLPTERPVSYVR